MVPQEALTPDVKAIEADLAYTTSPWHELKEECFLELRAFAEDRQPQTARFALDWLEEATEWAARMNETGMNVYAMRNPVRDTKGKSATDADVIAARFLWADCDDGQAASNVKRFDGPKYSAAVTTGRTPETRVHIYWKLDEWCRDLDAWRDMQTRIAAHFKSDGKVINPSRIMRVGGTVAYPDKKKVGKGYVKELASIRTQYDDARPPVSIGQMARVFAATGGKSDAPMQIDTGPQPLDRERTRIQALSGQEWHNAMIRLVGSYVSKGLSDDEIHGLTDPLTLAGYTVEQTRREVQVAIDGARRKGWTPETQPEPVKATPQAMTDFRIDSGADFLADLEPLEYLIDGILPRGVTYSLTGHAGHGKTTLALQFALSVALGEDFAGRPASQGKVLILAGENPYNVKWQYAAALAARDIKAQDADIHFVQGRFSIQQFGEVLKAKLEQMPDVKLVIVDSLQAFFEGDNDNDNTQMVEMAHRVRSVVDVPSRPALLVIAHPAGKTPSKDNLVPRGGGAFLNEIDGNLTVWSQDASQQTLHHSQKFRGASFEPAEFVMQIHEFSHLTDIHGVPLKLPVSRPELMVERANREQQSDDLLKRYLWTVDAEQPLSEREMASQFGVSRYRAKTIIGTARDEKLIKRYAKTFVLTQGGKDFLEGKNAGE